MKTEEEIWTPVKLWSGRLSIEHRESFAISFQNKYYKQRQMDEFSQRTLLAIVHTKIQEYLDKKLLPL